VVEKELEGRTTGFLFFCNLQCVFFFIRLCLVRRKVWILVEIEDDVTEKLCVYDRLM